ncbi:MAG: host attachment family protein [Phyllobacterium sp.]|uniref:host attachment family protein n=1 Tax=Phyllobacterium sp. TaxID=1871046 RepID=UPI0030F21868
MERVKISRKTWVVICDGAKALILRNDGDAELLNLIPVDVMFEVHPPTQELGSDRQGRTYKSQGAARSAVEETDWHSEAERSFLAKVADWLNSGVQDHSIRQVVLIAPPKALGILRDHLLPSTRATVIAEIAKDLVKMPIPEIEKHLAATSR